MHMGVLQNWGLIFLGVPTTRIIVHGGLYWGSQILDGGFRVGSELEIQSLTLRPKPYKTYTLTPQPCTLSLVIHVRKMDFT